MANAKQDITKEVTEIKFLIHDLRVEKFFNEIIHFHVTLNTDLEIHSVEQAQILHGQDLQALKAIAVSLRKAFQSYSNAVKSFSPDKTILLTGRRYIDTIFSACELILNPLWGRIDKVMTFLPPDSRSVQARIHYLNCIRWIRGVYRRIGDFKDEMGKKDAYQEFDIAAEIESFTREVVHGYVMEHSRGHVQIELDRLDSAIVLGSLPRFRRMYFNLIMNAVDAMSNREVGVLNIGAAVAGDRIVLSVRDNGEGMTQEKMQQLLTDRETLDGELDSLGFVFVRQTIEQFKGELSIETELDKGTRISVSIPCLRRKNAEPSLPSGDNEPNPLPRIDITPRQIAKTGGPRPDRNKEDAGDSRSPGAPREAPGPVEPALPDDEKETGCGRLIYKDYEVSEAKFPGSIFSISVAEDSTLEFFTHRPQERYWNLNHEDLSPMCFESSVRGRLEEDDQKRPVLILKDPQSVKEYFEFKNVPEKERSPEKHVQMVHDEYIRVARKLIDTGLSSQICVELAGLEKFFPGQDDLPKTDPFPLELLAKQALTTEKDS